MRTDDGGGGGGSTSTSSSTSTSDDGGALSSLSGGAEALLSDPRKFIATVVVGMLFGLFEAVLGQVITAGSAIAGALGDVGGAFEYAAAAGGAAVLESVDVPFEVLAGLAGSAGPLAPLFVAVGWVAAGAFVAGLVYLIWRVGTWI